MNDGSGKTDVAWFALSVKTKFERSTAQGLRGRGLEDFLPMQRVRRRYRDRIKEVDVPLFPGYVFCRFPWTNRLPVLTTPGVMSIVTFDSTPTPIPDTQIDSVRAMSASGLPLEPWTFLLNTGHRVRIEYGPLAGLEGTLVQLKDSSRVVVNVNLLQRSVAVEVDRDMVASAQTV